MFLNFKISIFQNWLSWLRLGEDIRGNGKPMYKLYGAYRTNEWFYQRESSSVWALSGASRLTPIREALINKCTPEANTATAPCSQTIRSISSWHNTWSLRLRMIRKVLLVYLQRGDVNSKPFLFTMWRNLSSTLVLWHTLTHTRKLETLENGAKYLEWNERWKSLFET